MVSLENSMGNGDNPDELTPKELREGVRSGILASLRLDVDLRGGRAARLLASAGLIGIAGAVGAVLLISGHPFGHHAPWHVAVFSSVWAGLLVVCLSIAFLHVRTPSLPLARAACVGILGLGLAGICGAACPDQHFLHWWSATGVGATLESSGGLALSALCFGGVTTLFFGAVAAVVALRGSGRSPVRPLLPAAMLLLLLSPGVALQSVGTSWGVFLGWLSGTAGGAYLGVAGGIRLRTALTGN
jgi:hypothetical protein